LTSSNKVIIELKVLNRLSNDMCRYKLHLNNKQNSIRCIHHDSGLTVAKEPSEIVARKVTRVASGAVTELPFVNCTVASRAEASTCRCAAITHHDTVS